uniref:Zgc:113142 n=1 Tax=Amphilophus citrinellus TaxID=61819 RepID=A0A3Q0QU46_AMPCI
GKVEFISNSLFTLLKKDLRNPLRISNLREKKILLDLYNQMDWVMLEFNWLSGLWAVVNNAGISDWAEIEWSTIEDFRNMVDVNLFGCIRTSIAFLPLVRATKGRIVFVSSIFSFFYCLNMGAYSVSKRGLEAFADCLRVEMASFGVKVLYGIIQPGNFGQATNILKRKTSSDIWNKLDDEKKRIFGREYIELANDYFTSTCRAGFKDAEPVVAAMLHAVTSAHPKHRYLLVSVMEMFFFRIFPFLPTILADAMFSLSSMYAQRKEIPRRKIHFSQIDMVKKELKIKPAGPNNC